MRGVKDRTPRSRSQEEAGCASQDRNSSVIEHSFSTLGREGEALKRVESRITPRYTTLWDGRRLDCFPVDDNTELLTKTHSLVQGLEYQGARRSLDQPVVQVSAHANTQAMQIGRDRSHDPCKNLRSRRETETKSLELKNLIQGHKSEVPAMSGCIGTCK